MAPEGITVLTHDGSDLTPTLCAELQALGHQVAVLTFPSSLVPALPMALPDDVTELKVDDVQDATLQTTLAQLPGPVSQLIHLHPQGRRVEVQTFADGVETALVKAAFLLAKHVKASVTDTRWLTRPAFMTVVRQDGAFGTVNTGSDPVLGSGLAGLTKSLAIEWPGVFCRFVDLAPTLISVDASRYVRQELYDADQCLIQTAYDESGKRFTLVAEPAPSFKEPRLQASINESSVFLVTGGGRGITASCVSQMALTFRCTFILLGRTVLKTHEPDWAQAATDPTELKRRAMEALKATGEKPLPKTVERMVSELLAQREIQQNIAHLQSLGARVFYRSVDVTDADAVQAILNQITPATGPITGLLHGAGRLADKRIEHKTEVDFDQVFNVKVQGLQSVLQALPVVQLQHVVFFSSVAGFYGNAGQTDYAMANEVLNRFAFLFKAKYPQAQVVSINWGAWDSGMVSPELKKLMLDNNVLLVPSDEGGPALVDQLSDQAQRQVQVLLGGTLPVASTVTDGPLRTYTIRRQLTLAANPFLAHHHIQGHAVLPINIANAWMTQTADTLYPGFLLYREYDVKLFKGIVFDSHQPTNFLVTVQELEKNKDQLRVSVLITSPQRSKLPVPYYRSEILLVRQRPKPLIIPLPDATQTPVLSDASTLYQDGTLFHGTDFQGIRQIIRLDEHEALFYCEHPGISWERQGQFPVSSINGFLTDVMYQGLLIWVRRFRNCACLPLTTNNVEMTQALAFGRPFYVSLHVVQATEFTLSADLVAFDAVTGVVCMKTERASVTISRTLQWAHPETQPL